VVVYVFAQIETFTPAEYISGVVDTMGPFAAEEQVLLKDVSLTTPGHTLAPHIPVVFRSAHHFCIQKI
jgi:hypothetical protein